MCQAEGIGWSSIGFYVAHWFVLGSQALGGVRIYLVKYTGKEGRGVFSKIKCIMEIY
jgi:hypothetical protein